MILRFHPQLRVVHAVAVAKAHGQVIRWRPRRRKQDSDPKRAA